VAYLYEFLLLLKQFDMVPGFLHAFQADFRVSVDNNSHIGLEEMRVQLLQYVHGRAEAAKDERGKYVTVAYYSLVAF